MTISKRRRDIYRRAGIAYCAACALPLFILLVSMAKGAGWRPMLIGIPAYVTFFFAITYQVSKELRAINCEKSAADIEDDKDKK
ncbi:hypothetical protein [Paraburkholderia diazotrophica]|uniref:hypothetical protein n=1 Tax=Paraburkholderia diazotrophica TaxID=667676 RepID=UPI00317DF29B